MPEVKMVKAFLRKGFSHTKKKRLRYFIAGTNIIDYKRKPIYVTESGVDVTPKELEELIERNPAIVAGEAFKDVANPPDGAGDPDDSAKLNAMEGAKIFEDFEGDFFEDAPYDTKMKVLKLLDETVKTRVKGAEIDDRIKAKLVKLGS